MDKREAFEFIFQEKFDYMVDYIERNGFSSLLLNISHLGISGNDKRSLDTGNVTEVVLEKGYAPMFAIQKTGSKYKIYYLWSNGPKGAQVNEREAARKSMQAKSEWFFPILQMLSKKPLHLVDTRKPRGYHVGDVKQVKDIAPKIEWYNRHQRKEEDSLFIRVKKNTSSISIFEVFRSTSQSAFSDLDKIGVQYKVL